MRNIDRIYIDGAFVAPHGTEHFDLFNPATEAKIGAVRLGDAEDLRMAVAAAKRAFPAMAATSKTERIAMLHRLRDAVEARTADLVAAMTEEYGAPAYFTNFSVKNTASIFDVMAASVENYAFERTAGSSAVTMLPLGVVGAITPWNSNFGFIATKLAHAIGSGSSIVIKPAEQSAIQTQLLLECLHDARLPAGVLNVVNGTGPEVGSALTTHPDVALISFTGSTRAAKLVQRDAIETMKRLVLELGGKSPTIILDDANLDTAIPAALMSGFANSGQACVSGSRILVPRSRQVEISARLKLEAERLKVGAATDHGVHIGPLANAAQWERVQHYIRLGQEDGATLLTGGEGRPERQGRGWFAKPTIFVDVTNSMRIAREEIFGPVLCVIAYDNEADAVSIANDSDFGLQAYVLSSDEDRAVRVARQLVAGRVVINGAPHDPYAPFGGFRQSGLGREIGAYGLDRFLEPRAILKPIR
ncbi:aldehyde dehydrogenase family protein [Acetobacter sacchari]|uniref:Aldehyde dehydrogenase family protein n=1 Tax=Acetobacter sacchari TaxID=2661687 RepID=A0ABS3LX18_9PROT|nr:aldehyde dehydrogenase family protein [Acetobacter sacchari]MBO1360467.1 aldehyde dehydrogenase family protein [Acetobacter sacchari]